MVIGAKRVETGQPSGQKWVVGEPAVVKVKNYSRPQALMPFSETVPLSFLQRPQRTSHSSAER